MWKKEKGHFFVIQMKLGRSAIRSIVFNFQLMHSRGRECVLVSAWVGGSERMLITHPLTLQRF